jgi:tRNA modification GTPase
MMASAGDSVQDTIVARATPRGASALSIVRLSGPEAISLVDAVFPARELTGLASHTAHVGYIGREDAWIDQVVCTLFKAPSSATGEDIVEISCHGGDVASDAVVRLMVEEGARMAGPGEFTLRAFMNGKVDLAQAEAIGELIHAQSQRAGREEDVAFADRERLESLLEAATSRLDAMTGSFRFGQALHEGVRVVIVGKPNAGKSTLMNALLGYDRVIVSEIPGTTRDEVESHLEYEGVRFTFVDTAGRRETDDEIEAEGVRRSQEAERGADLILHLVDLTAEEIQAEVRAEELPRLVVGNKRDLVVDASASTHLGMKADFAISAEAMRIGTESVDALMTRIFDATVGSIGQAEEHQVVTSQRQQEHIRAASSAIQRVRVVMESGGSGDMISSDVREVIEQIGAITGEVTNEDILDRIFSQFCIGK